MMQIHSVIPYMRYYQMWHRVSAFSGGALNDKVSHLVDVFNWMNEPAGANRSSPWADAVHSSLRERTHPSDAANAMMPPAVPQKVSDRR